MARTLRGNGEGHNSAGMIDGEALKRYCDRVVSLMEDRKALNNDIKEVYEEAKEAGFVTKHLRARVREAMLDPDVLADFLAMEAAYRSALGQLDGTALGDAAVATMHQPQRKRRRRTKAEMEAAKEEERWRMGFVRPAELPDPEAEPFDPLGPEPPEAAE